MCLFTSPTGVVDFHCNKCCVSAERTEGMESLSFSHIFLLKISSKARQALFHISARSHSSDGKISGLELHEFLSINFTWKMSREKLLCPSVNRARFTRYSNTSFCESWNTLNTHKIINVTVRQVKAPDSYLEGEEILQGKKIHVRAQRPTGRVHFSDPLFRILHLL